MGGCPRREGLSCEDDDCYGFLRSSAWHHIRKLAFNPGLLLNLVKVEARESPGTLRRVKTCLSYSWNLGVDAFLYVCHNPSSANVSDGSRQCLYHIASPRFYGFYVETVLDLQARWLRAILDGKGQASVSFDALRLINSRALRLVVHFSLLYF